jgi:hypothetical protein
MVARPRSPDGNNVAITVKVSDNAAAAIDEARGELTRSAWARDTLTAALDGRLMTPDQATAYVYAMRTASPIPFSKAPEIISGMASVQEPPPDAAEAPKRARAPRVPPLAAAGLAPASSLPPPRRCRHPGKRLVGGYCKDCDHLIEAGGAWA